MKKIRLTKKELAETEARQEKAKAEFIKKHKGNPGPVTNFDVARILGMPEDMIEELFGKEDRAGEGDK